MALHDSEGLHMTYDFMRPGKVKVVTLIHLSLNISITVKTAAMGQIPCSTERILVNVRNSHCITNDNVLVPSSLLSIITQWPV